MLAVATPRHIRIRERYRSSVYAISAGWHHGRVIEVAAGCLKASRALLPATLVGGAVERQPRLAQRFHLQRLCPGPRPSGPP